MALPLVMPAIEDCQKFESLEVNVRSDWIPGAPATLIVAVKEADEVLSNTAVSVLFVSSRYALASKLVESATMALTATAPGRI